MKTKYIFNLLALAMLMPAMLLTTACSNEDDVVNNTENIANKGYELPVTVNVTRQDAAATRATFDGSKLNFGEGDKLFVKGNDYSAGGAGFFAGTLTWQSGGTFSGTILTENAYSGTIDALFTPLSNNALATLLPANYGNYPYLSFTNKDTYSASVNYDATKTFATSKATAVEQFSFEVGGYTSGTGFALHPANAILNFTITGLAASTEVDVALSHGVSFTISGSVTTDDLGTATFAAGVSFGSDLNEFSLTVAGNAITLVSSTTVLAAGKIYNITRSAAPAGPKAAAEATAEDLGKVIGDDGKIYADAAAATAAGHPAVALITYVGSDNGEAAPYNHGLALALNDASTGCKWCTSTGTVHTYNAEHSSSFASESGLQYNNDTHNSEFYPAFKAAIANNGTAAPTGCSSWFLASGYQWKQMIGATGLNNLGLTGNAYYWSSTERDADHAWIISTFDGDSSNWGSIDKDGDSGLSRVRACLAF